MEKVTNINEVRRSNEKADAKDLAQNVRLTDPLNAQMLQGMTLEDLLVFKRILVERAVAIISRVQALKAKDDLVRSQFERRMWRGEEFVGDERVFNYSCEPRFAEDNLFVPGAWFQQFLDELEILENKKTETSENFETNEKARLIRQMCGANKTVGYIQPAAEAA